MSIKTLMKKDLVVASPEETVVEAARRMASHKLGALVVVQEGRLVGIFTERDILNRVVAGGLDPRTTKVQDVATKDPMTVPITASLSDCFEVIRSHDFRHVPVVDGQRPVGMLSSRDFLRMVTLHLSEHVDLPSLMERLGTLHIDMYRSNPPPEPKD